MRRHSRSATSSSPVSSDIYMMDPKRDRIIFPKVRVQDAGTAVMKTALEHSSCRYIILE